ncbi:penicillin-binding protein activator LpoB [Marispirochaeta aestuarii]|uniref:Penicillin-binding protein activator LpoB n=1 Tax=Marispirochaeta aestuarii TaxID=1963862 RepID=A0A1Y1RT12_9SPIO|nr:penicillin-binding protein activator LpoB [Marispirochaeta aestuarii]ORC30242.1 penicillin-binding protein activator LpoB [Marispirochaeta aestuarii]
MRAKLSLLIIAVVFTVAGCATSGVTVERTAADTQTDLSGRWNDTDSRLVAEEMIRDMSSRPWLGDFRAAEGRKPVLIVGSIRNKSSEHIDTTPFVKDIERELINGGQVTFVANPEERVGVRAEKEDQQFEASQETIKRLGEETGADFMLIGSISSQVDAIEGKRATLYQVDMELINIENMEKVWIGTKKIKKLVEQSKVRW